MLTSPRSALDSVLSGLVIWFSNLWQKQRIEGSEAAGDRHADRQSDRGRGQKNEKADIQTRGVSDLPNMGI